MNVGAEPDPPARPAARRWWWIAAALAATIVAVAAVVVVLLVRSDDGPQAGAPGTTTPAPATTTPPATSLTSPSQKPSPDFAYQPLWPFADADEAASWQRENREGGHQPWHLDPDDTALAFTRSYLGYTNVDRVISTKVAGRESWVGVGYALPNGRKATAAVIHLAQLGTGGDAPWEVVGTRDSTLTLDTPRYGATITSPVTVGGRITGVDENLRIQIRALDRGQVGKSGGIPAGGDRTPWSAKVSYDAPPGSLLTIAVATGGHVEAVERFAITGVRTG
jgi:hypothetical protein